MDKCGSLTKSMLEMFKDNMPPRVIRGDTGSMIAKKLCDNMESSGKKSFTVADIREAERSIFEGSR